VVVVVDGVLGKLNAAATERLFSREVLFSVFGILVVIRFFRESACFCVFPGYLLM